MHFHSNFYFFMIAILFDIASSSILRFPCNFPALLSLQPMTAMMFSDSVEANVCWIHESYFILFNGKNRWMNSKIRRYHQDHLFGPLNNIHYIHLDWFSTSNLKYSFKLCSNTANIDFPLFKFHDVFQWPLLCNSKLTKMNVFKKITCSLCLVAVLYPVKSNTNHSF